MKRILIVEDNREISDMLVNFLERHGYETECAYNGKSAAKMLVENQYTVVLMDLMLPYKSGETLIGELRRNSDVPVICLSAKSSLDTRLEVLKMGADDYILKPFDLNEVLVRIEVLLRRSGLNSEGGEAENVLQVGDLELNEASKSVSVAGTELSLTGKELAILELMMRNPKKTFSKANIYESVWNEPYFYEDNTLNVHMSNLRSKLKKAGGREYIKTVWGIGYRIDNGE